MGEAPANALAGDVSPAGRSPYTWPTSHVHRTTSHVSAGQVRDVHGEGGRHAAKDHELLEPERPPVTHPQ